MVFSIYMSQGRHDFESIRPRGSWPQHLPFSGTIIPHFPCFFNVFNRQNSQKQQKIREFEQVPKTPQKPEKWGMLGRKGRTLGRTFSLFPSGFPPYFKTLWGEKNLLLLLTTLLQRGVYHDYRTILPRSPKTISRIHNQGPDVPHLPHQQKDLPVSPGERHCSMHRQW